MDWEWAGEDNRNLAHGIYGDSWDQDLQKLLDERWGAGWADKDKDPSTLENLLHLQALPFAEEEMQKDVEEAFGQAHEQLMSQVGAVKLTTDATEDELANALIEAVKADPAAKGDPAKAAEELKAALAKSAEDAEAELDAILEEQKQILSRLESLG